MRLWELLLIVAVSVFAVWFLMGLQQPRDWAAVGFIALLGVARAALIDRLGARTREF